MTTRRAFALWFGFEERVGRSAYAATGFALMALKYGVDALIVGAVLGSAWTPLDYLSPLLATKSPLLDASGDGTAWALLVWTLPFVWVGASMTVRRAIDAGLSGWVGLLFFVPVVNYLAMLILCFLPSASDAERVRIADAGRERVRGVLVSAFWGALLGVASFGVSVYALESYGTGLFVGTPFVMGFVSRYVHVRGAPGRSSVYLAGQISLILAGGTLLLFALEGVLCLAMAWPLAAVLAAVGSKLGGLVGGQHRISPTAAALVLATLPALIAAEASSHNEPMREVGSRIEIDSPPKTVWRHVIGFAELPPPTRFEFWLGIAHPQRATIRGRGVGAIRTCHFSTGPFVEPITVWDEPRRLAFDVASQPEPMHEWSPYRHVYAPHLVDGLVAHRGEFRLSALPEGRTLLEGSTWYTMSVAPRPYWSLYADRLIHTIHMRVLGHVKRLAERDAPRGAS